jgi:hypothetical protein
MSAGPTWLGCGASPSSPTSSQSQTDEFIGISRKFGRGCDSDFYKFAAAEGPIRLTLVQTTPATSLSISLCSTSANGPADCTFNFQQIDIGQTLEARRTGPGAQQQLYLYPASCGIDDDKPPASFAFTARVTYLIPK